MNTYIKKLHTLMRNDQIARMLLRGVSGTFALNIAGRIISFILFVILARMIGVEDFGFYVLGWSWGQLLMVLGKFGSDATASKYIAAYKAQEKWDLFHGHLQHGFFLVLAKSLGLSCIGALVIWIIRDQFPEEQALTFWIVMGMLPFLCLIHFVQASLRAVGNPVRGIFANTVFRSGFHILLLPLILFMGLSLNAPTAMMTALISAATALALASFWLYKDVSVLPKSKKKSYEHREWYVYSLYILMIASGDMIFRQTDTVMLGWLAGAEEAGLYGAASRIGYFVIFGVSAANFVVTPMISEFFSTKNHDRLQRTLKYAAWLIFGLASAISLVIFLAGSMLLGLFGEAFKDALLTQNILVIGQLLTTLAGPVGSLMIMTGHEKIISKIFALTAILNVLLNATLIPLIGMEGAAVATALAFVFWNGVTLFYVVKKLSINPTIFPFKVKIHAKNA